MEAESVSRNHVKATHEVWDVKHVWCWMAGKKILSLLETQTFPFNTFSVTSYSVQAKTKSLCHTVGTASLLLCSLTSIRLISALFSGKVAAKPLSNRVAVCN